MKKLVIYLTNNRKTGYGRKLAELKKAAILVLIMIQIGCANLYKINTSTDTKILDRSLINNSRKQLIIHLKDTVFALTNSSITNNNLIASLTPLNDTQIKYSKPKSQSKNIYEKRHEEEVLNEVHLYALNNAISDTANFSIPVTSISKINTNEINQKATKKSKVIGGIVLTTAALGIIAVLISSAMSNMFSDFHF
jgi:hypothetical protein